MPNQSIEVEPAVCVGKTASSVASTAGAPRVRLLWLGVDNLAFGEAASAVVRMCRDGRPAYVVTPNVNHFMHTRTNPALRSIYERAGLSLADGMPVVWAARLLGRPLKAKVSGSDLFYELCGRAAAEGLRLFLLGGAPGVAERAADALRSRYAGLHIVGTHSPVIRADGAGSSDAEVAEMIREARPHVVFVAFGSPKQELWMARNYRRLGSAVCIGIGASFDFAAGTQSRAPRWIQRAGFEWLWRLLHEPRRLWKRYLVDDLPFLWHVARERLRPSRGRAGRPERTAEAPS
ncbi:MAG TPA: WecB/TagA/CpsF family glycosyltransferase [Planctomycetota bacterium]|nr:WecB/TagA/CpsF family glycosyltransferase [Planctomycetota bacterium]